MLTFLQKKVAFKLFPTLLCKSLQAMDLKIVLAIAFTLVLCEPKLLVKFHSLSCGSSFQTLQGPFSCGIKSFSRKNPVMNVNFTFARKTPENVFFKVNILIERKQPNDVFDTIINLVDVEYCKTVDGKISVPLFDKLLELLKSVANDLAEVCFRSGSFKLVNVTFTNHSFISLWPPGYYRITTKFFDLIDDNIINFTLVGSIYR